MGEPSLWRILNCGALTSCESLDLGVRRIKASTGLRLRCLGVCLVGIFALADGLQNSSSIPLCELDLLDDLGVRLAPFAGKIEESCSGVECIGGLSK